MDENANQAEVVDQEAEEDGEPGDDEAQAECRKKKEFLYGTRKEKLPPPEAIKVNFVIKSMSLLCYSVHC